MTAPAGGSRVGRGGSRSDLGNPHALPPPPPPASLPTGALQLDHELSTSARSESNGYSSLAIYCEVKIKEALAQLDAADPGSISSTAARRARTSTCFHLLNEIGANALGFKEVFRVLTKEIGNAIYRSVQASPSPILLCVSLSLCLSLSVSLCLCCLRFN